MTIAENKKTFYTAVSKINRPGIENLIKWLENETDFFTAPASTQYHGNYEGGLLEHSLNVLSIALHNYNFLISRNPDLSYLLESIIICSLFHDLCKVNTYVKGTRNVKENGVWREKEVWKVEDKFPLGHGEKSIWYITKFIELKPYEALAIRWHMGNTEQSVNFIGSTTSYSYYGAMEHPLVRIIHISDMMSLAIDGHID